MNIYIKNILIKYLIKIHERIHDIEGVEERQALEKSFKHFGEGSRIKAPYLFYGNENIYIGAQVRIHSYSRIEAIRYYGPSGQSFDPTLRIEDGTTIEMFCHIGANNLVVICQNVMIAGHVFITDHLHKFENIYLSVRDQDLSTGGEVIIGKSSFIGEGVMILPNVHLGEHCVVGANSVVTKDFPAYTVIAGIPAKPIRSIKPNTQ